MARAWGCTPAQLRDCTVRELGAMLEVLTAEAAANDDDDDTEG